MKKTAFLLFFTVAIAACTPKVAPSDLAKINGYWEIEKVILPNGEEKKYTVNDTYDYFEINGNAGFRKKAMPQFDGTFLVNGLSEKVKVVFDKEKAYFDYTTDYAKWREELLKLTDTEMVLLNAQKNEYHYKKASAFNFTGDGKKTQ